jgi:hypothetical protein
VLVLFVVALPRPIFIAKKFYIFQIFSVDIFRFRWQAGTSVQKAGMIGHHLIYNAVLQKTCSMIYNVKYFHYFVFFW